MGKSHKPPLVPSVPDDQMASKSPETAPELLAVEFNHDFREDSVSPASCDEKNAGDPENLLYPITGQDLEKQSDKTITSLGPIELALDLVTNLYAGHSRIANIH